MKKLVMMKNREKCGSLWPVGRLDKGTRALTRHKFHKQVLFDFYSDSQR